MTMTAFQNFVKSLALPLAIAAPMAVSCATTTPETVAEAQRDDRIELTVEQREEKAAFEKKQQNERSGLVADQATANATAAMANELDQSKFAIDVRERIAKYDARMVELRKIGKPIDPATVAARDAIAAHNELCDNEKMSQEVWSSHRDQLNSELVALGNQIERDAKNKT
jgi:hypothetical protein